MQPIEVHGHRGSRGTHPENTFAAFEEAWRVGADWFELDIRPTADGDIVVFHDPGVDRTNARRRDGGVIESVTPVVAMTRDELDAFDVGFTQPELFPLQQAVPGSRIPSLVDVFRWLGRRPGISVNVELKADGIPEDDTTADVYCRRVADAMAAAPLDRMMMQSFDPRLVEILKRRYPRLRTAVLYDHEQDYFGTAESARAAGSHDDAVVRSAARRNPQAPLPTTSNRGALRPRAGLFRHGGSRSGRWDWALRSTGKCVGLCGKSPTLVEISALDRQRHGPMRGISKNGSIWNHY